MKLVEFLIGEMPRTLLTFEFDLLDGHLNSTYLISATTVLTILTDYENSNNLKSAKYI